MPEEMLWNDFFDLNLILKELQINSQVEDLVEIGCGYGTFTLPAARLLKGNLYAFDIEQEMIDLVRNKIEGSQHNNIILRQRDVLDETTGLNESSVDYVMLFNILHHESPQDFFDECHRILKPKGKIGIIHWRSDILTPRGPELRIRPNPELVLSWLNKNQFEIERHPFTIKPYHFGLVIAKR